MISPLKNGGATRIFSISCSCWSLCDFCETCSSYHPGSSPLSLHNLTAEFRGIFFWDVDEFYAPSRVPNATVLPPNNLGVANAFDGG